MKLKSSRVLKIICGLCSVVGALPALAAVYKCVGKFENNGIVQTVTYQFGYAGGLPNCNCELDPDYSANKMIGVVMARNGYEVYIGHNQKTLGITNGNHPWSISSCYLELVSN